MPCQDAGIRQVAGKRAQMPDTFPARCIACVTVAWERSSVRPSTAKPPRPRNNFPFNHPCIHLSARVSFLLDELISLPSARCLSDPRDPRESPNRLLLPIRIDWSVAPCQGRSIHHSFSNEAPARSPPLPSPRRISSILLFLRADRCGQAGRL